MGKGLQCELKGFKMPRAKPEEMRAPRIVRIGIIQHGLVVPTSEPIRVQRDEIHKKIASYIEHAAACGANIVCMQELWSKYCKTENKIEECKVSKIEIALKIAY